MNALSHIPNDPRPANEGLTDFLFRQPKIELHLHLEGAIPLPCLWTLIQKYGGDSTIPDMAALAARFTYHDFPHFIDTWAWKNQFLREYDDFTIFAEAVAQDLAAQHILYAEVFYSPMDFERYGLETLRLTEAIRKGLNRVPAIEIALIADVVRDYTPEQSMRTLETIRDIADETGIIGIGLGGSEHAFPAPPFAPVFERARQLGFRTTAHAGEAAGPAAIWDTIRTLQPDRIGHATHAGEDPALIDYLAVHRIPIEVCLISNLRTGAIATFQEHPVRLFYQHDIPFSINTDDPKLFNNSLVDEYQVLHRDFGFSLPEIIDMTARAVMTSWLPDERKQLLVQKFSQF